MLEEVRWIQFHSPLFHAGKNFGEKIDVKRHAGLRISYDEDLSLFYVSYQNRVAKVPWTSAFMWEPVANIEIPEVVNEHKTEDVAKRRTAQVSTPMGHVFEGPGKGKTK